MGIIGKLGFGKVKFLKGSGNNKANVASEPKSETQVKMSSPWVPFATQVFLVASEHKWRLPHNQSTEGTERVERKAIDPRTEGTPRGGISNSSQNCHQFRLPSPIIEQWQTQLLRKHDFC